VQLARGQPDLDVAKLSDGDFAMMRIPTQSGRGFRFDVGRRSDLMPVTIPK
jgi:hypothetical protein